MRASAIYFFSFFLFICINSCDKTDDPVVEKTRPQDDEFSDLVASLESVHVPLEDDPLAWTDDELQFMDPIANHTIIGLGEATHGTAEFFNAKFRIFKYLVEHHDFRIFAIEADFGESVLINDVIQKGKTEEVESKMKEVMHFWTWETTEVRELIKWMCEYNKGVPEGKKLQYVGVDCQFNSFNPYILINYLRDTNADFFSEAESLLSEVKDFSMDIGNYTSTQVSDFRKELGKLKHTMNDHKVSLIAASSEKAFFYHYNVLIIIDQVIDFRYGISRGGSGGKLHFRDAHMADNTVWLREYFDDAKMVIWAHNFHISNRTWQSAMGYHLKYKFPDTYAIMGFMFSYGTFNAVDNSTKSLKVHSIVETPIHNSINNIFRKDSSSTFYVSIDNLEKHENWNSQFIKGMTYLSIGSIYSSNNHENYFGGFSKEYYDHLIYFNKANHTNLLD